MPSRLFRVPSRMLRHRTVSLLPDAENIIKTSMAHFVQHITSRGEQANLSISINLLILSRLVFLVTDTRKGRQMDPDAVEWCIDLIDGKRHITKQDLEDYSKCLDTMTHAYNRRHLTTNLLRTNNIPIN